MQKHSVLLKLCHSRISNLGQFSSPDIFKRVGPGGKSWVALLSEENTTAICSLTLPVTGNVTALKPCTYTHSTGLSGKTVLGFPSVYIQKWFCCCPCSSVCKAPVLATSTSQIYLSKGMYCKGLPRVITEAEKPQSLKLVSGRPRPDEGQLPV